MTRILFHAMVIMLVLGAASEAAELSTPPIFGLGAINDDATAVDYVCRITNVGAKKVAVGIQVVNAGGTVVAGPASPDTVVSPGGVVTQSGPLVKGHADGPVYCRFLVNGAKHTVRAVGCLWDGKIPACLEPAEAR